MRFLLHGATNWNSTNFGDFLYAYEIYRYLKQNSDNQVGFYQPSDYFVKYLNSNGVKTDYVSFKNADYLIYIPGGYFGEGHNARFRDTLIQYIRFMPFGLKAVIGKKKLVAIGVGAGPIDRWFMKWAVKSICKNSIAVTTRDKESQEALKSIGVDNVPEYSDMMLAYDLKNVSENTEQINSVIKYADGCKILMVHYNHSKEALEKFAVAVNDFVEEHKEYKVVVTADSVLPYEDEYFQIFKDLCKCEAFHFIYDNPFEMLKLIDLSGVILTCKLHVGVVGGMFNKSVICVAEHPEKTQRFYDLINNPQNCVSLYETTEEHIKILLNDLHNKSICIPNDETEKAKMHWSVIDRMIEEKYEE